jgi:hypothetical protein
MAGKRWHPIFRPPFFCQSDRWQIAAMRGGIPVGRSGEAGSQKTDSGIQEVSRRSY